MRFGFHLSTAGGAQKAAQEAARLGLDCLQIFSGNPRGWNHRPLTEVEATEFREGCRVAGLRPVVVHAHYLINLASPDDGLWRKSVKGLADQLVRARLLGADAVVVHPGSRMGEDARWGVERVRAAVEEALAMAGEGAQLWLENTAGGGGHLGGSLRQMASLLKGLAGLPVGACLDTAHAWGAGYRLDSRTMARRFVDEALTLLGTGAVKLWHLNDTVEKLGSHKDHHYHLGRGYIGPGGFAGLVNHPGLAGAAGVMETPKDSLWADRRNLAWIKRRYEPKPSAGPVDTKGGLC